MNSGPLIFVGLFFAMSVSWYTMVFKPMLDLGRQTPVASQPSNQIYPQPRSGFAKQGADIYRANGCVTCHTQQARDGKTSSDKARGWGVRLTVAQDYLLDQPPQLGWIRLGPDLSNAGTRLADAKYQLLHLYNPQMVMKGSKMPPYKFLFETRKIRNQGSSEALALAPEYSPAAGYEVVPTDNAKAVVAYVMSLRSDLPLFEAPMPQPKTNAPATDATNNAASATSTNSPAAK